MNRSTKNAWKLLFLLREVASELPTVRNFHLAILARSPALGVRARMAVDDAFKDHPHSRFQAERAGHLLQLLKEQGYRLEAGPLSGEGVQDA